MNELAQASTKIGGEIAATFAQLDANCSPGGSELVRGPVFVGNLTNTRPDFTELRRAGYQIRTGDLQLGNPGLFLLPTPSSSH